MNVFENLHLVPIKARRDWIDKQLSFPWIRSEYKLVENYNPPVSAEISVLPDGTRWYDTDDGNIYERYNGDWLEF